MTQRKNENRRREDTGKRRQTTGKKYEQGKVVCTDSPLPPMPEEMRTAIALVLERLMEIDEEDIVSASVSEEESNAASQDDYTVLEVRGDVRVVAIYPTGLLTIMKMASCVDVFDWFMDSEVCEPVPGVKDVYMTYDYNKLVEQNGHKWVFGPLVLYHVDKQNNIVSLTDKDINLAVDAMEGRTRKLFDTVSAEQLKGFYLE